MRSSYSTTAAAALVAALAFVAPVTAQLPGCIQLTGSTQCPGFSTQYINPINLTSEWPFFATVTDVASFDRGLSNYLATQWETTKYQQQLGCSNTSSNYVIRYARTFLCSEFTQISYSGGCYVPTLERRMMCQGTCLQFAASENTLVGDALACGATNLVGSARQGNLTKDFTSCTDWTTLQSNNTATCVLGALNEPQCGFGTGAAANAQLCAQCNPTGLTGNQQVDYCCGQADISACGYRLSAAQIAPAVAATPTASSIFVASATSLGNVAASSAAAAAAAGSSSGGLSGGAIAGIVIGTLLGVALLIALLAIFLLRRRRRNLNGRTGEEGLERRNYTAGTGSGASPAIVAGGVGSGALMSEKVRQGNSNNFKKVPNAGAAGAGKKGVHVAPSSTAASSPGLTDTSAMMFGGSANGSPDHSIGRPSPDPSNEAAGGGLLGHFPVQDAVLVGGGAAAGGGILAANHNRTSTAASGTARPLSGQTATTAFSGNSTNSTADSNGGRNLVSSYRDQYSTVDITPGTEVVAIYAYAPNLPDELRLEPEMVVQVRKIFDDGWAVGTIVRGHGNAPLSPAQGAFPLVVCTAVGSDMADSASSRSSSSYSSNNAVTAEDGATLSRPRSSHSGGRRTSSIGHGTIATNTDARTTGRSSFNSARTSPSELLPSSRDQSTTERGGFLSTLLPGRR